MKHFDVHSELSKLSIRKPPRHFSPEEIYPDLYQSSKVDWTDLCEEDQTQLLEDYYTANPDVYFEAVTDASESEDFMAAMQRFIKTMPWVNLSQIEDKNEDHYDAIVGLYDIAKKMFGDYIASDIQRDLLDDADVLHDRFYVEDIDRSSLLRLRKHYQNNRLAGGVA